MRIARLDLPPGGEPKPKDLQQERAVLSHVLDELESGTDPRLAVLSTSGITEWVAWQLGVGVEYLQDEGRSAYAIACGIASIVAADRGGWPERSAANRNSLARVLLEAGDVTLAKRLCEDALHIAGPQLIGTFASSRSLLGIIAIHEHETLEAVRHYDSLFRVLRACADAETIRSFAKTAVAAYRDATDSVGLAWCLAAIDGEAKALVAWDEILSELRTELSIEYAMSAVTRLNAFGLHGIATEIEKHLQHME